MKQCNPELESLQQAVRDADKRALCSQEARVKAEAESYRLEQERDELRDMLRQAYHFVPFGWAGRAKLENLLDKGDS